MTHYLPITGIVLTALVLTATGAAGQSPHGVFSDTIEVRVVNVEVVVVDADGNRVSGLGPQDFRLEVDGEQVPIGYFSEIREGVAVASGPEIAKIATREEIFAAATPAPAPVVPAGVPVRTSYLVFVDDYFARPSDRNLVLDELRDDLGKLTREDRVAMVAFDGRKLELLTDWTSSHDEIAVALDEAARRPAWLARLEVRQFDARGLAGGGMEMVRETLMSRRADQLRRTFSAVEVAMRSFATAPGRRVLLMMSGGWPFDVYEYYRGVDANASPLWRTREELRRMFATANLTGFTVYPVDVPGLESYRTRVADTDRHPSDASTEAAFNLQERGGSQAEGKALPELPPDGEQIAASTLDYNWDRFVRGPSAEHQNETSLLMAAEATGGKAMINSQRLEALATAVDDTRSYYWLGFAHQRSGDDRRHKIRVEPLPAGLRVRARQSFSDLSREAEVDLIVESLLLVERPPDFPGLRVELGQPSRSRRGKVEVPFSLAIPLREIVAGSEAEGFRLALELRIAAVNEAGDRSEVTRVPIDLHLSRQQAAAPFVVYDASVRLRNRSQQLAFVVFDLTSGNTLGSRVDLEI